jgi:hypothetical protein
MGLHDSIVLLGVGWGRIHCVLGRLASGIHFGLGLVCACAERLRGSRKNALPFLIALWQEVLVFQFSNSSLSKIRGASKS